MAKKKVVINVEYEPGLIGMTFFSEFNERLLECIPAFGGPIASGEGKKRYVVTLNHASAAQDVFQQLCSDRELTVKSFYRYLQKTEFRERTYFVTKRDCIG